MKRRILIAVAAVMTATCAFGLRVANELMDAWTVRRIPIPIVAGTAVWTNVYPGLAVANIEAIGIQAAGSNTAATGTFAVVSAGWTNPPPQWSTTTNRLAPLVTTGIAGTATGYGSISNLVFSFYGDTWTGTGFGTNTGGILLLSGWSP